MKAFIIKNINIGLNDNILKEQHKFFYDFLFPILKTNYKETDYLFILGNLISNKDILNIKTISFIIDIFDYLLDNKIKVFYVLGNNELKNIEVLKLINKYKNVKIVEDKLNFKTFTFVAHNQKTDKSKNIFSTNYEILNLHLNKKDLNKKCGIEIFNLLNNNKTFIENNINKQHKFLKINNLSEIQHIKNSNDYYYIDIDEKIMDLEFKNCLKELSYKDNIKINIIENTIVKIEQDFDDDLSTLDIIKQYIGNKLDRLENDKRNKFISILDETIKIAIK